MTLPSVVRIFFAIEIPDALKEKIGHYQSTLKKASKTHGIRWTKNRNLHITLQFLAHVHSQDLDQLIEKVQAKLRQAVVFPEMRLAELEIFPSAFRPRVIVLKVLPPNDLTVLSRLIGEGIVDAHYQIECKPYRPHLTLGRIKHTHEINLQFLSSVSIPDFGILKPQNVTLYRSNPQADGSQYTVIERFPLWTPMSDVMS
jgi:2'-5' RNA ligase